MAICTQGQEQVPTRFILYNSMTFHDFFHDFFYVFHDLKWRSCFQSNVKTINRSRYFLIII